MSTRSRRSRRTRERDAEENTFDDLVDDGLDTLSGEELEAFLFDEEEEESKGLLNLPTTAGLSLIVVGIVYMLQQMGVLSGAGISSSLVAALPWLAGILIILLGFGVLSWRPSSKKAKKKVKKAIETSEGREAILVEDVKSKRKARLTKSRNKKVAGVAAGLAEYFNLDPTLVRIAFVIGTIASGGPFLVAYLILAMVLPTPEPRNRKDDDRIIIIRDR
ncbi:MAG: PspC domain-containing protein [Bacteroidota bacterium]